MLKIINKRTPNEIINGMPQGISIEMPNYQTK